MPRWRRWIPAIALSAILVTTISAAPNHTVHAAGSSPLAVASARARAAVAAVTVDVDVLAQWTRCIPAHDVAYYQTLLDHATSYNDIVTLTARARADDRLLRAAEEVMALGISLHAALALVERMSRDCDSISRGFTRLFLKELWEPFEQAGQPEERWDELIAAVGGLRPIASEALLALFKLSMTTQLEGAFGKVIEHQAKRK